MLKQLIWKKVDIKIVFTKYTNSIIMRKNF